MFLLPLDSIGEAEATEGESRDAIGGREGLGGQRVLLLCALVWRFLWWIPLPGS